MEEMGDARLVLHVFPHTSVPRRRVPRDAIKMEADGYVGHVVATVFHASALKSVGILDVHPPTRLCGRTVFAPFIRDDFHSAAVEKNRHHVARVHANSNGCNAAEHAKERRYFIGGGPLGKSMLLAPIDNVPKNLLVNLATMVLHQPNPDIAEVRSLEAIECA